MGSTSKKILNTRLSVILEGYSSDDVVNYLCDFFDPQQLQEFYDFLLDGAESNSEEDIHGDR